MEFLVSNFSNANHFTGLATGWHVWTFQPFVLLLRGTSLPQRDSLHWPMVLSLKSMWRMDSRLLIGSWTIAGKIEDLYGYCVVAH